MPVRRGRPGRATRPAAGSRRPNRSTSLLERGRPRFHDLPRDEIRVDDHRAAPDEQLGDRRFPRPDPAGQPHHQHAAEPSDAAPQPASGVTTRLDAARRVRATAKRPNARGVAGRLVGSATHFPRTEEEAVHPFDETAQRHWSATARTVALQPADAESGRPASIRHRAAGERDDLLACGVLRERVRSPRRTNSAPCRQCSPAGSERSRRTRPPRSSVAAPAPWTGTARDHNIARTTAAMSGACAMHRSGLVRSRRRHRWSTGFRVRLRS